MVLVQWRAPGVRATPTALEGALFGAGPGGELVGATVGVGAGRVIGTSDKKTGQLAPFGVRIRTITWSTARPHWIILTVNALIRCQQVY
jgi:hypothetical protein